VYFALLELAPRPLMLTAVKPATTGSGLVVRVLNPTAESLEAHLRLAAPTLSVGAVLLDETPSADTVAVSDGSVTFEVPPHAPRSVLFRPCPGRTSA
jgi:alpha-mannosidase